MDPRRLFKFACLMVASVCLPAIADAEPDELTERLLRQVADRNAAYLADLPHHEIVAERSRVVSL